jgi:hypothetical protein
MNWDGTWAWGWLLMVPMMLLIWATIRVARAPLDADGARPAPLTDRSTG